LLVAVEAKGGRDEKSEVKEQAAQRWAAALNADGRYGEWRYAIARDMNAVPSILTAVTCLT
jgi:type III restriction enzyme